MSPHDDQDLQADFYADEAESASLLEQIEQKKEVAKRQRTAAYEPMLTTLFKNVIRDSEVSAHDPVLRDFVETVLTPLADELEMSGAKGGAFYRMKAAEHAAQPERDMRDPEHYAHDQTMRAHLLNGMLPALRIARHLKRWEAQRFFYWSEEAERLLIAGYLLHDYTKLSRVKAALHAEGFEDWHSPNERMIPALERIFSTWCERFGLDVFLQPIGGVEKYLHDIIYIAHNTQVKKGTIGLPSLLPNKRLNPLTLMLVSEVSRLADLIAYTARTPREMVKPGTTLQNVLSALAEARTAPGGMVARLTYHHVAENRGVLLNFIHEAALNALSNDFRVPFLYAPSGVVYLERTGAQPFPSPDVLIAEIVADIRNKASRQLIQSGKGAKVNKDGLRTDSSFDDYLDLRQFIRLSSGLIKKIGSNAPQYIDNLGELRFPHSENLPQPSRDKKDTRLRQMAEWASLIEIQLENRFPEYLSAFVLGVLRTWNIEDLHDQFQEVKRYKPEVAGTGIRHYWYWAALYALDRSAWTPDEVFTMISEMADALASSLPDELPVSAQVDQTKWIDMANYLQRVFSVGGEKSAEYRQAGEINRYTNAKKVSGKAICALCGETYKATKPKESVIAFQPGVYTARLRLNHPNDNTRRLCSICALEQFLRQLFVDNLRYGVTAEDERTRYLSFYPSYFFTPETLTLLREVYSQLSALRLSEGDLRQVIAHTITEESYDILRNFLDGTSKASSTPKYPTRFWTRLTPFMLLEREEPSRQLLRYSETVTGTFFSFGLTYPHKKDDKIADITSWIVPTLTAFILTVALDLKVVISEGGVPIITESDELPETLWLDGAHPAIRAVLDIGRDHSIDRLHVDEIVPALTRLAIAYLIHLDTEIDEKKNKWSENWNHFPPLAHALAESPLYVFHYLIKQERDGKPLTSAKLNIYVTYALLLNPQGDPLMDYAKRLVQEYRQFYRVRRLNEASSYAILRPIDIVADALLTADPRLFPSVPALINMVLGQLHDRLESSETNAYFVRGRESDAAMQRFCDILVSDIFDGIYKRDVAALRGKQLNLLRSACEVIYRAVYWSERGREADEPADDSE